MNNEDEITHLKEIEITSESKPKKLKSKKKYNSYQNEKIFTDNYTIELICFSLFTVSLIIFIIVSIILYISKINKHFITEEDNNKAKILDYIETSSNMNELERNDIYCELCEKGFLFREKEFKISQNPKITIIVIVCDNQNQILRLLRSIQNQNFDDVEIIFIDNKSKDDTVNIIKKYKYEDPRIILIQNQKRKEKLMNIKNGLLSSKGEYIFVADANDLYSDNILESAYSTAKSNNYDIVGFKILSINYGIHDVGFHHNPNAPIYQPELSSIIFYENGNLKLNDKIIWNKLIKKEIFINAINTINNKYFEYVLDINGDPLILFALFKTAKSFYFINNFGYICVGYHGSLIKYFGDNVEELFKDYIIYLKYIFENTNNTKYEKNMAMEIFRDQYWSFYKKKKPHERIKTDLEFYNKILASYANCEFISQQDKQLVENVKGVIQNKLNQLNKKKIIKQNNNIFVSQKKRRRKKKNKKFI